MVLDFRERGVCPGKMFLDQGGLCLRGGAIAKKRKKEGPWGGAVEWVWSVRGWDGEEV